MIKLYRELYKEFFYIPKHGKVREKVMLARISVAISLILIYLASMSFTAYAYFAYSVSSNTNVIQSAEFVTTISVADQSNTAVEVIEMDENQSRVVLAKDVTYSVTIKSTGTSRTGFYVMNIEGSPAIFHTQQIGKPAADNVIDESMTFYLKLSETTAVTFTSQWGTSVYYSDYVENGVNGELYILNGETVEVKGITANENIELITDDKNTADLTDKDENLESTENNNTDVETKTEEKADEENDIDTDVNVEP